MDMCGLPIGNHHGSIEPLSSQSLGGFLAGGIVRITWAMTLRPGKNKLCVFLPATAIHHSCPCTKNLVRDVVNLSMNVLTVPETSNSNAYWGCTGKRDERLAAQDRKSTVFRGYAYQQQRT